MRLTGEPMEVRDTPQNDEAVIRLEELVGVERDENFSSTPDPDHIDLEARAIVEISERLACRSTRNRDLHDVVVRGRFEEVVEAGKTEAVGEADSHIMLREDHVIGSDTHQKFPVQVGRCPCHQVAYAHLFQHDCGENAVFDLRSDGQDHGVAVFDARSLEFGRVRCVCDDGQGDVIFDSVDVLLLLIDTQDLKSQLGQADGARSAKLSKTNDAYLWFHDNSSYPMATSSSAK